LDEIETTGKTKETTHKILLNPTKVQQLQDFCCLFLQACSLCIKVIFFPKYAPNRLRGDGSKLIHWAFLRFGLGGCQTILKDRNLSQHKSLCRGILN